MATAPTSTGQPGVRPASIHTQRKDEMFNGIAAIGRGHRVQKERARVEIDNGCASDAGRSAVSAWIGRHGRANIALPDNAAIDSVQRVDVIRIRHCNDGWSPAWTVIDVEWLRENIARNGAVEIRIAYQIGGSALRESSIDIKTITRSMVVMLGHVDLSVDWNNRNP